MGMSATQANLLFLTSRLHDVENAAQFIESEKIALATQQDEIYQTYCAALDATKIQVAFNSTDDGKRYFVDATFENVCMYDPTRCKQYSLTDAKTGKLYVTSEMKEAYEHCKDDKYSFAWEMLEINQQCSAGNWNGNWGETKVTPVSIADNGCALTDVEELVFRHHADGFGNKSDDVNKSLNTLYENYIETLENENATNGEKLNALFKFRDAMYSQYGNEIFALMRIDKQAGNTPFPGFYTYVPSRAQHENESDEDYARYCVEDYQNQISENSAKGDYWYIDEEEHSNGRKIFTYADFEDWLETAYISSDYDIVQKDYEIGDANFPKSEFDYYVNMWQSITNAGGCTEIPLTAIKGDESNQWFNSMVKSGRAIINVYNETTKEWGETNVATSVNVNFLQENQDETDLKKAEAEYEYQLSVIEKKDTEFDRQLSKLETERSSIKQIMESIKTVKNENIDRTFNIFS